MRMLQLVADNVIVPKLKGTQRDDVITELVDALIEGGAASPRLREELVKAVLERERRGSTGFGRGVAVPHVKHKSVKSMSAAIGLSERGVEFNALDKQPVYSVFLLLSPEDRPEEHLQAIVPAAPEQNAGAGSPGLVGRHRHLLGVCVRVAAARMRPEGHGTSSRGKSWGTARTAMTRVCKAVVSREGLPRPGSRHKG